MSSGQFATDDDFTVECASTYTIDGIIYPIGCTFVGLATVRYDPEVSIDEAFWECPECGLEHTDLAASFQHRPRWSTQSGVAA
jgi:hypothetical protein